MNVQNKIAEYKISNNRRLIISESVIETGNKRSKGIDIRKYNSNGTDFVPTQKGIFLTKEEFEFVSKFFLAAENSITEFLSDKGEGVKMLR